MADTTLMFLSRMDTGGQAPVWVTVLVARFVGGFTGGYLGYLAVMSTVAVSLNNSSSVPDLPPAWIMFAPMLTSALATGIALSMLLPSMSGRVVGLGNCLLAAFSGGMVPLIATLVVAHGLDDSFSPASVMLIVGASPFISILSTVGAIAITTWMVQSAATEGTRPQHAVPPPQTQSWSDIEAVDKAGAELDEEQAERGFWGGRYASDDQPKP